MTICSEIKVKLDVIIMTAPFVDADVPFYLNGESGDTYFVYNSTSERVELWVNGVLTKEWGELEPGGNPFE